MKLGRNCYILVTYDQSNRKLYRIERLSDRNGSESVSTVEKQQQLLDRIFVVRVHELTDCSVEVDVRGLDEATNAKYWITFFVFSVLPAPLSPLQQQVNEQTEKKVYGDSCYQSYDLITHVQRID